MYANWVANSAVAAAAMAAVALCVLVHYEGLKFAHVRLSRQGGRDRAKVVYGIAAVLLLHMAEIWVFGATYWLLLLWPETGQIVGQPLVGLPDAVYFSAVTFSTVGYGDIAPVGPIRFLAGTEGITGLVLIAWSASFTYMEMNRNWGKP